MNTVNKMTINIVSVTMMYMDQSMSISPGSKGKTLMITIGKANMAMTQNRSRIASDLPPSSMKMN
jgi:hypothetical protein